MTGRVTHYFTAAGVEIPILVGPSAAAISAAMASGVPVPKPILTWASVDTGSTISAVASRLLTALGSSPIRSTSTQTASGLVPVNIHEVSLGLPPFGGLSQSLILTPQTEVTELVTPLDPVEVLIGLSVLLPYKVIIDGPNLAFTIEY
jgi:hypothetical protein